MQQIRNILDKIFENHPRDFNVKLWNGRLIQWSSNPKYNLVLRDKRAFKRLFLRGNAFMAGSLYIEGGIDIEGDIFEAIKLADYLASLKLSLRDKLIIMMKVVAL